MAIPSGKAAQVRYFNRMVQMCLESRSERLANYQKWRNLYMFGDETNKARFNKLRSHLEDVSSLLFSEETVRFGVSWGARAERGPDWQLETLREVLNDTWHEDAMGLTVGDCLPWAFTYGTVLLAPRWRSGSLQLYVISPHNFGVANEKVNRLDRQEAFLVLYELSIPELVRMIPPGGDVQSILRKINRKPPTNEEGPEAQMPVVLSNTTGASSYTGVARPSVSFDSYIPKVAQDVVEMRELWVYDEAKQDYRVIIQAAPDVFILDRKNTVCPGRLPFAKMTPNPLPDYFWGESEIDMLAGLQIWRNKRFSQLDALLRKQENPPRILSGFQGITDEMANALNNPGSNLRSQIPSAKVEELAPNVPADALQEIADLDEMFNVMSGIRGQLFGNAGPNVRSHAHLEAAATLASARPKRRAMRIEAALNDLIALVYEIMRISDATQYHGDEGTLLLAELPSSVKVMVDGHSSSPVFAAQNSMIATELFTAGAIDPMSLLEMLNPPMLDTLKSRLKKMEAAQAKEAEHDPQKVEKSRAAHREAVSKLEKS